MSSDPGDTDIRANEQFNQGLRLGLASRLGNLNTFGDDDDLRDHYETFGWPKDPDDTAYLALYLRNAFARVVVDKPAFTTWRVTPTIEDSGSNGDATEFEDKVTKLARNHDLWSYCQRVDRVAGVGQHGLLAISFSDVVDDRDAWGTDARDADLSDLDDVKTFKPLLQTQIDTIEWGGPDSERWGQPEVYHIDWSEDVDEESDDDQGPFRVHWTRAIDVPATRLLDDETLARPRVEPVLNNLLDIEKTLGSAAEQSYRGADYGLHLNWDPEKVDTSQLDEDELRDEFQRWYHGLQPELKTQGAELTALGGEMQDPSPIVESNLMAIYAQTGIPKREFIGNQQGEQSGAEQDERSYFGTVAERQEQYATRHIVRSTIDRFRTVGVVPDPSGPTYTVEWPDLTQLSELEQAEVESNRASVVATAGQMVAGLTGEGALAYLDTGEFPDADQSANAETVDDTAEQGAARDQFEAIAGAEAEADD